MTLRFRTLFWSGTAVLVIALIGWSFWPRPVLVATARIERGALSVAIRDEGRTRIRDVYAIASPVSGRLLRIDWEPGDRIATGDVLARILPAEPSILDARSQGEAEAAIALAEAALSAARAEAGTARSALDLAREDHARIARLHETGIASQAQIDRAAAELRAAEAAAGRAQAAIRMREAEIEAARIHLHGSGTGDQDSAIFDIRSPIDGVVLQTVRESEGPVAAGAPLLVIGEPSGLEIVAEFLSADAVQTTPGDPAQITGWRRDARPCRPASAGSSPTGSNRSPRSAWRSNASMSCWISPASRVTGRPWAMAIASKRPSPSGTARTPCASPSPPSSARTAAGPSTASTTTAPPSPWSASARTMASTPKSSTG